MENDNKRKRPSQGLIDYLGGMYEKKEEERMRSFSYEPIYKNDTEKLNISDVSDSYTDEWVSLLDEFRKTDSYRKSNGQLLFPKFFEWLSTNYEIPKKKLI